MDGSAGVLRIPTMPTTTIHLLGQDTITRAPCPVAPVTVTTVMTTTMTSRVLRRRISRPPGAHADRADRADRIRGSQARSDSKILLEIPCPRHRTRRRASVWSAVVPMDVHSTSLGMMTDVHADPPSSHGTGRCHSKVSICPYDPRQYETDATLCGRAFPPAAFHSGIVAYV
jgi:hypothetical protein